MNFKRVKLCVLFMSYYFSFVYPFLNSYFLCYVIFLSSRVYALTSRAAEDQPEGWVSSKSLVSLVRLLLDCIREVVFETQK